MLELQLHFASVLTHKSYSRRRHFALRTIIEVARKSFRVQFDIMRSKEIKREEKVENVMLHFFIQIASNMVEIY